MSQRHNPAAPTGAEATTLYVAIELSRKSWVVGFKRVGCAPQGATGANAFRPGMTRRRTAPPEET